MSDCRIIIEDQDLINFLGRDTFSSVEELDELMNEIRDNFVQVNGKFGVFTEVLDVRGTAYAKVSGVLTPLSQVTRTVTPIGTQLDEDLDKEDDLGEVAEFISAVKFNPMSTTRQDVSGEVIIQSENNNAQRILLRELENNSDKYTLVAVKNSDRIQADAVADVVFLAVEKTDLKTLTDASSAIRLGYKLPNSPKRKPIGLTFELWQKDQDGNRQFTTISDQDGSYTVPVAAFFGTAGTQRADNTHKIRLDKEYNAYLESLTEGEVPMNAHAYKTFANDKYVAEFTELDDIRQEALNGAIVQLDAQNVSEGFYPPNKLTLDKFNNKFRTTLTSVSFGGKGMIARVNLQGTNVPIELYPTEFTKDEIAYMVNNFNNQQTPAVLQSYALLLGRNSHPGKVYVKKDGLMYLDPVTGVESFATIDQLESVLATFKYRQRSRLLQKPSVMYLGQSVSSAVYISQNFAPATGFYKLGTTYVADKANQYVSVARAKQGLTQNLDINVPVAEHFKPALIEIEVREGETIEIRGNSYTFSKSLRGLHDPIKNWIYYTDEKSLAEERVHAATSEFIDNNPDDPLVIELAEKYEKVKAFFETVDKKDFPGAEYSLTNIKEFIARGITDPDTMRLLMRFDEANRNTLDPTSYRSVVQSFIEFIQRVFNLQSSTVADLFDIYDQIANRSKRLSSVFSGLNPSLENVPNLDDPDIQIQFAQAMDYMLVMFASEDNITIDRVRHAIKKDSTYRDIFMSRTAQFVQSLGDYPELTALIQTSWPLAQQVWTDYSTIINEDLSLIKEEQIEDETSISKEFDGNDGKDFLEKSGLPKTPSIDEMDDEIRTILSTISDNNVNSFGTPGFLPLKEVFYETIDAVSSATTMEEMMGIMQTSTNPVLNAIYRILAQPHPRSEDLKAKFYRSFNRYSVPYKILKRFGKTWAYIQLTGDGTLKAENALVTNFYENAVINNYLNVDGSVSSKYIREFTFALNAKNFQKIAELLGMPNTPAVLKNVEFQNWLSKQGDENNLRMWREALAMKLYSPLDMKQKAAKPIKELTQIYMNIFKIDRVRMALTPENNPIAAESSPNTLIEMTKLYKKIELDQDGDPVIPDDIEYGFLRSPAFKHLYFKDSLQSLRISFQGGFKDTSTVNLSPDEWTILNTYTTLVENSAEFMRTETSSSSWTWGTDKQLPKDPRELRRIIKQYVFADVEGYLNRGTENYNFYDGNTLMVFKNLRITEELINHVGGQFNPQVDQQIDRVVSQFINDLQQDVYEIFDRNNLRVNSFPPQMFEALNIDTQDPGGAMAEVVRLYAQHSFIYRMEEAVLFNGGIQYYKDFYKRAKIKISTGSSPLMDPEFWDSIDPDTTLSEGTNFKPELKTAIIEEPVVSYKSGSIRNNEYVSGDPEFEALFQPAVEMTFFSKRLSRFNVTKLDVIKEMLPKFAPYSKMEIADGQGRINIDYYRILQKSVGNWPDTAEAIYQWERLYYKSQVLGQDLSKTRMVMGKSEVDFFSKKPEGFLPPVKYSYFGPTKELGSRPFADKFALAPMLPSVYHNTKYESLLRQMVDNRIAYVRHPSSTKVGVSKTGPASVIKMDNLDLSRTDAVVTLSPRFFKEQEKTSFKNKKINIFGSQGRKLIFSDTMEMGVWMDLYISDEEIQEIFKDGEPTRRLDYFKAIKTFQDSLSPEELMARSDYARRYETYKHLMARSVAIQEEATERALGLNRIYSNNLLTGYSIDSPAQLAMTLRKYDMKENPAVAELLRMLDRGENKIMLEASSLKNEIEKIFISVIKKTISLQKVPGQPMIQVSSAGMEPIDWVKPTSRDFSKYGQTGLRYYQMKDGQVLPAQIKLTYSEDFEGFSNNPYISSLPGNTLREKLNFMLLAKEGVSDQLVSLVGNDAELYVNEAKEFFEQNKKSFMVFAYRIPTQGLSSMDAFEIREFLPESAGKTIIPPLEIVAKSGADFDIDKMYFFKPTLSKYTGRVQDTSPIPTRPVEDIREDLNRIKDQLELAFQAKTDVNKRITQTKDLLAKLKGEDPQEFQQAREALKAMFKEKDMLNISGLLNQKREILEELLIYNNQHEESKAVVLNEMLSVIIEQITSPLNFANLVTPLSAYAIKEAMSPKAKEFYEMTEGRNPLLDARGGEILRPSTEVNKRVGMLVNKSMLGIAAVSVPSHQLFTKAGLKYTITQYKKQKASPIFSRLLLVPPDKRDDLQDGTVYDFSSLYTTDGFLKSELYNQYVSATVDGAKEDYLGFSTHNLQTFPVVVHLIRQGVPIQRIADFITSPPLRILEAGNMDMRSVRNTLVANVSLESGVDFNTAYKGFIESLPEDFDLVDAVNSLNPKGLFSPNWINSDSTTAFITIMALDYYSNLKHVAGLDFDSQRYINIDTKPVATAFDPFLRRRPSNTALATASDKVVKNSEITPLDTRQKFVYMLSAVFPMSYNHHTLTQFTELERIALDTNRAEGMPKATEKERIGFRIRTTNAWLEFLLKNTLSSASNKPYGSAVQAYMTKLPAEFARAKAVRPDLMRYKLIRDMRVFNKGTNMFTFGLVRDTNDTSTNRKYYEEFNRLYADPETRPLALTIARVSLISNGFDKTFYSFVDIIPPSLVQDVFEDLLSNYNDINVPEALRAFSKLYLPIKRTKNIKPYESYEATISREPEPESDVIKLQGFMEDKPLNIDPLNFYTVLFPLDAIVNPDEVHTITDGYHTYNVKVIRVDNQEGRLVNRTPLAYKTTNAAKYTSLNVVVEFVGEAEEYLGERLNTPFTEKDMADQYSDFVVAQSTLKDFTVHSLGSSGPDTAFENAFKGGGATVRHYYHKRQTQTERGNTPIEDENYTKISEEKVIAASKKLWKGLKNNQDVFGMNNVTNTDLLSLWAQVEASEAVIAIAPIGLRNEIWISDIGKTNPRRLVKNEALQGISGYVAEMAIQQGKPVYVYNDHQPNLPNQKPVGWYEWNERKQEFVPVDIENIPTYKKFAGTGIRTADSTSIAQIYNLRDTYAQRIQGTDPLGTDKAKTTLRVRNSVSSLFKVLPKSNQVVLDPNVGTSTTVNKQQEVVENLIELSEVPKVFAKVKKSPNLVINKKPVKSVFDGDTVNMNPIGNEHFGNIASPSTNNPLMIKTKTEAEASQIYLRWLLPETIIPVDAEVTLDDVSTVLNMFGQADVLNLDTVAPMNAMIDTISGNQTDVQERNARILTYLTLEGKNVYKLDDLEAVRYAMAFYTNESRRRWIKAQITSGRLNGATISHFNDTKEITYADVLKHLVDNAPKNTAQITGAVSEEYVVATEMPGNHFGNIATSDPKLAEEKGLILVKTPDDEALIYLRWLMKDRIIDNAEVSLNYVEKDNPKTLAAIEKYKLEGLESIKQALKGPTNADERRNAAIFTSLFLEGKSLFNSDQTAINYARVLFREEPRRQWIRQQIESGSLKGKRIIFNRASRTVTQADVLSYLINNQGKGSKPQSKVEIVQGRFSRASVKNDSRSMYLFTDNLERTSDLGATETNIPENSWYYIKYKNATKRVISYGTDRNPTSALIRGLNNSYPISTMKAYGKQWEDKDFALFKATIDDEIAQIKQDLPNFSRLKIGNYRIGQGGRLAKLPSKFQNYLDLKLREIGIENSGETPQIISKPEQVEIASKLLIKNTRSVTGARVTYQDRPFILLSLNDGVAQLYTTDKVLKVPADQITVDGRYPVVDGKYIVVNQDLIISLASNKSVFQTQPNQKQKLYNQAAALYTYTQEENRLSPDDTDSIARFNQAKLRTAKTPSIEATEAYITEAEGFLTVLQKLVKRNNLDQNTTNLISELLTNLKGSTLAEKLEIETANIVANYKTIRARLDVQGNIADAFRIKETLGSLQRSERAMVSLAKVLGSEISCKLR